MNVGFEVFQTQQRSGLWIPTRAQHSEAETRQTEQKEETGTSEGQAGGDIGDSLGDQEIAPHKDAHAGNGRQTCEHGDTPGHSVSHVARDSLLADGNIADTATGHPLSGTLWFKRQ